MALRCGINRRRVVVVAVGQGRNPRAAVLAAFRLFLVRLLRAERGLLLFARQRCPRNCPAKALGPILYSRPSFSIRFNRLRRRWLCVLKVEVSIVVICKRRILKRKRYKKA